ncbi:MAG: ABC transporter ATP-binding protein [Burkholderiales bacterium]|nr:ABC transporter ATP-binding protein [Burkholderiales bacterium]
MSAVRLETRALAFGHPGRTLARDVGFTLAAGEALAVLGPNGGGKTTLFRTLLGLLPRHGGEILLDGRALEDWDRRSLARTLGYVPQQHAGYFNFTVREAVLMGRTAHVGLFATPAEADRAAAAEAIEALGIGPLADRIYTRISGGERQLALIARALAQGPRLLVMDEPTASLDFGNQALVLRQIRALAARGIGVIFSTHDPDHALACADRVMLLKDGVLALGAPHEAISPESLERLYGVHVDVVSLPAPLAGSVCVPRLAT